MKQKYSIIIIPSDHDKKPRQIQFSIKTKKFFIGTSIALGMFFTGLFVHDIYQIHYINVYEGKIAYINELEEQLQAKNLEIARLNGKSAEINERLSAIAVMESRIAGILKINQARSNSSEISRGGISLEPTSASRNLDQASLMIDSQMESMQKYYAIAVEYENKLNHTPSIMPVSGELSSEFGYRRNPFGGWSSEFHSGIDIACDYATPVRATAAGTVTFAGYDGYWGRKIDIDHGYGIVTFYAHNSKLTVSAGDEVQKGEVIAYSGNSGRSTGSHLHYGAYINGKLVDPLVFTTKTVEQ
ncbi:M23 family metallopeptidase [Dehalobacter sp. DCM]|uniref:M23 family metallopeptidase n=1 Tax=Dehalobacter sp. DCM TaxID=2907827 RepID=UPI0030818F8F|nr:M23 family metallopeptidase [Dehalobacter sp. DCM]